jgi:pSer/pThr/pTyr-binding forkhead associated (FHA) protein
MAKLVVLSEGFAGRSHDLTTDRTTVGRVEDNTFPIAEASVSSHHCEVLLMDGQVRIKDLNSTNGTFIDGNQITEGVLKPGQLLRLGKVELKLEGETPGGDAKKIGPDATVVMPKGVTLGELGKGPITAGGMPSGKGFAKKDNRSNRLFIIIAGVVLLVILGIIIYLVASSGSPTAP